MRIVRTGLFLIVCGVFPAVAVLAETPLPNLPVNGDRLHVLPAVWEFRRDPDDTGLAAGWQDGLEESGSWKPLLTTRHWAEQLTDPAIRQRLDPSGIQLTGRDTYYGIGWYRTGFLKPHTAAGTRLILELGGAEESCWVFLNGRPVGTQIYDSALDPHAWNKPRRFDITSAILDGENRLVMRVQALAGLTGLYGGAVIRERQPNYLTGGCFAGDLPDWHYTIVDTAVPDAIVLFDGRLDQEPLPGFFTRGDGEYVEEESLMIRIPPGRSLRLTREETVTPAPGRYLLRVRYLQTPEPALPGAADAPFTILIRYLLENDGTPSSSVPLADAELSAPTVADGNWETLRLPLILPETQPGARLVLSLNFERPGVYRLGEISLSLPFP